MLINRISEEINLDVVLPAGIEVTAYHRDATVASIATSSSMMEEEAEGEEAQVVEGEAAAESTPEA